MICGPVYDRVAPVIYPYGAQMSIQKEESLEGVKSTVMAVPRAMVLFQWPKSRKEQHHWRDLAREFCRSAFFVGFYPARRLPKLSQWPPNVLLVRSTGELKQILTCSTWSMNLASRPGASIRPPDPGVGLNRPLLPVHMQWGYFQLDAQGRLVSVSKGLQEWLEKTAGLPLREVPLWKVLGWPHNKWKQVARMVLKQRECFSWCGAWETKNGVPLQICLHLEPWSRDPTSSPIICGALFNETPLLEMQKALLESEQRYRALVELSPDAVGVHCRGRVVYVNSAGARLLGAASPAEIIGQPILRFIHPDSEDTVKQRLRMLLEAKSDVPLTEEKLVRLDGQVIYVEVAAMPMEWKGEPAVQVVLRDVSQRKRVERQLRNLAEQRKRLLDMSYALLGNLELKQIPSFVIDFLQNLVPFHRLGVFLWDDSRQFLTPYYTYISPEATFPKPPPSVPRKGSLLGRAAESGQALLVNYAHQNPESYYPHGEHFPIEHLMGLPLKVGEEVLGVIGLQREKEPPFSHEEFETAQIFANLLSQGLYNSRLFAGIRRSEEKYRRLFEESGEGVFISTPEGRIVDINPAGLEILGFPSREALQNSDISTYYLNPLQRLELLRELEEKGVVRNRELKLRRPDGKLIIIEETATVVRDETGKVVAFRGIFRDVTEQKQLAEQLRQAQKMESLGTLAGGIAHDFNNLLGIILGYSSLLEQGETSPEKVKLAVDAIKQAVQRGTDLVNQILTFARRSEAVLEVVDANVVVRDVLKLVKGTFPKNIHVQAELADGLPYIEADRGQLNQVLLNLCLNARDAMPEGGTLTLRTRSLPSEEGPAELKSNLQGLVQIEVADTGIGMDEATQQRIFEPFFTTKERGRGTGLGLAVVYGIVQGHGGTICLLSSPGKGTTFTLYFPSTVKQPKTSTEKQPGPGFSGTATILVVEDEPLLQELLQDVLSSHGYTVWCAGNGLEALGLFSSHRREIDLVVLDFGLPGKNGWQVYQEFTRLRPGLPGILASGMMDPAVREKIADCPTLRFVPKPYDPGMLLTLIEESLRQSRGGVPGYNGNPRKPWFA